MVEAAELALETLAERDQLLLMEESRITPEESCKGGE
jgi:hypothetical protein